MKTPKLPQQANVQWSETQKPLYQVEMRGRPRNDTVSEESIGLCFEYRTERFPVHQSVDIAPTYSIASPRIPLIPAVTHSHGYGKWERS